MSNFKRFLSLVVALVMVIGMVPGTVFATEEETAVVAEGPANTDRGYYLTIYNADGSVGMNIDGTKSASAFCMRTALEDARVFADSAFLFGLTTPVTYVVDMYGDSTENESFEIGANVTINGNGHKIVCAEGVVVTNNGTLNDAEIVVPAKKAIEVTDAEGNVTYLENFQGFSTSNVTLKLLADVGDYNLNMQKATGVVLDLNGYTFSKQISLMTGSELTIIDSSAEKTGKVCSSEYAVWIMNGDLTVESGTVETTSATLPAIFASAANVQIEGGKIVSTNDGILVGDNFIESRGTSTIVISGGEIEADGKGIVSGSYSKDATSVAVSGGKITSTGDSISMAKGGSAVVSGGTFSSDVSDYVAEGFEVKQNADGSYGVAEPTPAAKIGEQGFATLADALAAAATMTGDVTVEIYDKVTLAQALTGSFNSIKFVGKDADAEIYMDIQGAIYATGKKAAFEDLKLSKVAGGYIADAGFRNLAFGLYGAEEVTYTGCTFVNGAYASSGKETYTNCTFYRSHDRYGMWVYGDVDVTVDGCTFADIRGIKMYDEGKASVGALTVKDTSFSAVTGKPAIVLTYGESVTLAGNTYNAAQGVFELDLDGAPNGTPVTSDVAPTCKNDNGACGVLVDGKIYTTVAQAAEVATSGSEVTLLHNSAENVELAEGVVLEKNGFTAEGITVKVSVVAKVGEQGYETLEAAFAAAVEGDTIVLLADATPDLTSQRAITKAAVIDLGGKTLTLTEDDLYFGTTTFKNGTIVVDSSVKPSTAVFWMFANQTLTFDNVKIVATGVTGTYLIGLDGNNSDLNLLNGSEIVIENTTALDLDVICVNASTGNDIVIEDSKVNVTNLDGRVFFRGNYTVKGTSDIDLSGITKAGFRIEAGQTLTIADTATVDIAGEPRDGGIHLTDATATYTKADTATVNATVNAPRTLPGEGTEANPYLIESLDDLKLFRDKVNGGETYDNQFVKLAADIDLAGEAWTPIGNATNKFLGTFDGGNYTISNLKVSVNSNNAGLFGFASVIKNVKINNAEVSGVVCVGALVGELESSVGTVDNCHITGTIQITGENSVGGLAGKGYANIKNSSVSGAEGSFVLGKANGTEEGDNIGGLMGHLGEGNTLGVSNVTVKNITVKGTRKVGGVLGTTARGNDNIGCIVENVTVECTASADYANANAATTTIGGVIGSYFGSATSGGVLKDCSVKNLTLVAGNAKSAGALVGGDRVNNGGAPVGVDTVSGNTVSNVTGATNKYLMPVAAQIGTETYETVAAALEAAKAEGLSDVTITLVGAPTQAEAVAREDIFDLYTKTEFNSVTFKQEDPTKTYYISGIYTGSRVNGGNFVFDGVNIVVTDQYVFEGNVVLKNNAYVGSVAEANCFIYNGTTTIEPGSKLKGVIEDFRGGDMIVDGGKTDGTYNTEPDMQDAIMVVNWSGDKLILKNGAYVKINAANEVGRLTVNSGAAVELTASKLDVHQYITLNAGSELLIDGKSEINTGVINGAGKIVIDATGMKAGDTVGINANISGFTGTIEVANSDLEAKIVDGKIVLAEKSLTGEGTEANPYLIGSLDDLKLFRDKVNTYTQDGSNQFKGKYVKLTADIDLAGINWTPIGTNSVGDHMAFLGTFDGDGHTISNLNVQQAGNGLGLFARTAGNAEIKNLTLHNVTVKSTNNSDYVGGLVGNAYASTKISNVHVTGNIDISGRGYIGGISGHGYVVMDNVSVMGTGTISSTFWCAGGILGYAGEGSTNIMNAHVEGITITSAAGGLGAIVGMAEDNKGTQPISGSNLSAKNVEIKTYTGAYGDAYADYALGYLYGGNPTSKLTGELSVENVKVETSTGAAPTIVDAAASIDGKIYFNLQTAVNAGGEVVIIRDITLNDTLTIPAGKTVTLDLNGKTISKTHGTEYAMIHVQNGAKLTINGDGAITYAAGGNKTGAAIWVEGALVQNGGTIEATGEWSFGFGVDLRPNAWATAYTNPATFVMNGGEVKSTDTAVRVASNSSDAHEDKGVTFTMNGGKIESEWDAIFVQNLYKDDLNVEVKDGSVSGKNSAIRIYGNAGCDIDVDVKGGTFTGVVKAPEAYITEKAIEISGGTYTVAPSDDLLAEGYEVTYNNTTKTFGVEPSIVAIVAGKTYTSLTEAIADAKQKDEPVYLQGDVSESLAAIENVTLATNVEGGVTFTNTYTGWVNMTNVEIASGVTLSTKNAYFTGAGINTIEGTLSVETLYNANNSKTTVCNGGKIVTTGMIVNRYHSDAEAGIYVYGDGDNSTVEVSCADTIGTYSGTFYAKGAVVEGNMLWIDYKKDSTEESDIYAQSKPQFEDSVLNITKELRLYKDATLTLTNTSVTAATVQVRENAAPTVTMDSASSVKANSVLNLAGAKLNAVLGEDGTVSFVTMVAKIGDVYYATLADAIAAAQAGETITVLENISNVDAKVNKTVTIDLNGKTLTDAYIIVTADAIIENGSIKNTNEAYPLVVQNGGKLTINDVAIEASKSDRAIWVRSGSSLVFNSGSVLATKGENNTKTGMIAAIYTDSNTDVTINGGTITVDTPNNKAVGIYGNYTNANVTVNGGKISTSGKNYSYGINVDGDITVNGGEIVTNEKGYGYSSGIRYGNNYALVTALGDVTITGGKITTNGYSGYAVNVGRTYSSNDQTITISGGEFANNLSDVEQTAGGHKAPVLIWEGSASSVTATITEGAFTGFNADLQKGDNTALAIAGGTFDVIPNEKYIAEGFMAEQNADGTYGVVVDPAYGKVAKIGDTYYATLAEAMAAAKAGETVTLLADVTVEATNGGYSKAGVVVNGQILDGNGHTLTVTGADATWDCGVYITAGTVKNLTVKGSFRGVFTAGASANIYLDNVDFKNVVYTFNSDAGNKDYGVYISNSKLNGWTSFSDVHKEVVFTNCEFGEGSGYAFCRPYNTTVFDGCTFSAGYDVDGSKTEMTFKNMDAESAAELVNGAAAMIKNGTETTFYPTLAEAMAAAKAGEIVTLLADIAMTEGVTVPAGKVITLDLNGKTITGTDNATGSFALITNNGDLTVKDSIGNGAITLVATNDRDWNAFSSVISNQPGGKLTVESGVIEHLGGSDMAYGIDNLTNGKGTYAETVINGGTVKSTYRAIRQFLNGTEAQNILTVNGGTIEGANKSIWMQDPSTNANTGSLTVGENATLKGNVYLTVTAGSTEWPVDVAIAEAALADGSEVATSNVPAKYVVECVNGTYGVTELDPVAKIGDVLYYDLAEAIEAAQDGDTITLLNDIIITADTAGYSDGTYTDGVRYTGDKSFTVDFAGFTVMDDGCVNDYVIYMNNKGEKANEITFKNGTIASKNGCWSTVCVNSSAATQATVLNLDGMKIVNSNDAAYSGNLAVRVRDMAAVNVNKDTVIISDGASYGIGASASGAIVNINDGATVIQKNSGVSGGNSVFAAVGGKGVININAGATITSDKYGVHTMTTGTPVVNVKGGAITAPVALKASTNGAADQKATIYVTGGIINGELEEYTDNGKIVISGGTFSSDVSEFCAEGFECLSDGAGNYVVVKHHDHPVSVSYKDYVAPTCSAIGSKTMVVSCETCGKVLFEDTVVICKSEHTVVIDEAKAPTLTETGLTAGAHCSECGTVLVEQEEIAKLTAVAKIGETEYATLQEAVNAATKGATIELLADGEIAVVNKKLTINRNGKTATVAAAAGLTVDDTTDPTKYAVVEASSVGGTETQEGVAYIVGDDKNIMPLQEALNKAAAAGGGEVRLAKDSVEVSGTVVIPTGVVLNIQAKTLKVTNLIGLNGSKLSADTMKGSTQSGSGYLIIAKDNLILDDECAVNSGSGYGILPVWNAKGWYEFAQLRAYYDPENLASHMLTVTEDEIFFEFRHLVGSYYKKFLLNDGGLDNGIKVIVTLAWENDRGVAQQTFVYNEGFFSAVNNSDKTDYTFTLKNYSEVGLVLNDPTKPVTITAAVVTDCGVIHAIDPVNVTLN